MFARTWARKAERVQPTSWVRLLCLPIRGLTLQAEKGLLRLLTFGTTKKEVWGRLECPLGPLGSPSSLMSSSLCWLSISGLAKMSGTLKVF